jgi:hypothetical protein
MAKKVIKQTVKKAVEKKATSKPKKAKLVATSWVTYQITNATYRLGDNSDAHYGLFLYQVRKEPGEKGKWLHRCLEKNGKHEWEGPITLLTNAQGEAKLAKAETLVGMPGNGKTSRKKTSNGKT